MINLTTIKFYILIVIAIVFVTVDWVITGTPPTVNFESTYIRVTLLMIAMMVVALWFRNNNSKKD